MQSPMLSDAVGDSYEITGMITKMRQLFGIAN